MREGESKSGGVQRKGIIREGRGEKKREKKGRLWSVSEVVHFSPRGGDPQS